MSRRILVAVLTAGAALALAIPAVARTPKAHRSSRPSLRMGGHVVGVIQGPQSAVPAANVGPATVSFSGFKCQVTVGQGPTDALYLPQFVSDSLQFYVPYRANGRTFYSVTTTCIGSLPPTTVVAPTIVSAELAFCGQFNPFRQKKFISGVGTTTTFPDGMFAETCNTPKFQ